ncbi:universal stress protein [Aureimonas altamirensis]|uniref:universal stress protein n=1 Tax=Aureimonas altamirensis TaxID=370622 RepID=UPI003017C285
MSPAYKTVMLTLLPEAQVRSAASPATAMAIAITRNFGGRLTIDFLSPQPAWIPYSLVTDMPGQMLAEQTRKLEAQAHASIDLAASAARQAGIDPEAQLISLDFLALVGRAALRAQLQDVVVVDAGGSSLRDEREIVEALLFRSGRPVIRVPATSPGTLPSKVLVAWDGSVPAVRAVREALPMLHQAGDVQIVTVRGEKDVSNIQPAEKLVGYLSAHGISASETVLTAARRNVADALRNHALDQGADLLVMGAYAHSRMQQAVLGGVTSELLNDSPIPLLLAH